MGEPFVIALLILLVTTIMRASYLGYPWIESFVSKKIQSYIDDCDSFLYRMFKEMPRRKMIQIILSSTFGMGLIGFLLTQSYGWINVLFTISFAWIGFQSLRWWLRYFWERRLTMFNNQLVDALTLLANSLKSGMNFSQSIQVLVQESKDPTSQEFGMVLSQEKLGLTVDEALEKMLDRVPSQDLAIAIQSVLILRETGGDLSETFETIALTIRERRKVTGKIQTMTQQGKMQGLILLLLPFGLITLLYFVSPPYVIPLFKTQLGWMMIFVMLLFQGVGALWIKKIVNIDV